MTGIGCDPATDGWSWTARKAEADAPGPEEQRRGLHSSSSDAIASSGGGVADHAAVCPSLAFCRQSCLYCTRQR